MALLGVQPLNAQVILHGKLPGEENYFAISILRDWTIRTEDDIFEALLLDPLQHWLQGSKGVLRHVRL